MRLWVITICIIKTWVKILKYYLYPIVIENNGQGTGFTEKFYDFLKYGLLGGKGVK